MNGVISRQLQSIQPALLGKFSVCSDQKRLLFYADDGYLIVNHDFHLGTSRLNRERCYTALPESGVKPELLCSLTRHTTALEQLDIECHTQKSDIVSPIVQDGSHIRTLNFLRIGCRFSSSSTLRLSIS